MGATFRGGHRLSTFPTTGTIAAVGEGVQSPQPILLGPATGLAAGGRAAKGSGGDAPCSSSSGEAFRPGVEGTGCASGEVVATDSRSTGVLGRKEGVNLLRRAPFQRRRRRRWQAAAGRFGADDPPVSAGRGDEVRAGISTGTVHIRRRRGRDVEDERRGRQAVGRGVVADAGRDGALVGLVMAVMVTAVSGVRGGGPPISQSQGGRRAAGGVESEGVVVVVVVTRTAEDTPPCSGGTSSVGARVRARPVGRAARRGRGDGPPGAPRRHAGVEVGRADAQLAAPVAVVRRHGRGREGRGAIARHHGRIVVRAAAAGAVAGWAGGVGAGRSTGSVGTSAGIGGRTLPRSDGKGIELLDQRCVDGASAVFVICPKIRSNARGG